MQHQPQIVPAPRLIANAAPDPRPAWLYTHDMKAEADDWWLECTDPENVLGECCTAYFEVNSYGELTLMGAVVEHDHGFVSVLPRERLLNRVTAGEIADLETRLAEFAA
mgnify:CR=1 FL=1